MVALRRCIAQSEVSGGENSEVLEPIITEIDFEEALGAMLRSRAVTYGTTDSAE
jgi:hypothetical protein